jgi:hypothetical protein
LDVGALQDLVPQKKGAPAYSKVIMTPNAYMTDEAWKEAAVLLAKGIRSLPAVRDHLDW